MIIIGWLISWLIWGHRSVHALDHWSGWLLSLIICGVLEMSPNIDKRPR